MRRESSTIKYLKESFKDFANRNWKSLIRIPFILIIALLVCLATNYTNKEEVQQEKPTEEINGIIVPGEYVGKFSISHYCSCPICTSTPKGSRTATGHIPREGRTVAVDPKIIPLHSIIYVEGLGTFVAEDVGGAVKGKHLDIYISDHNRALNLGTLKGATPKVYILN